MNLQIPDDGIDRCRSAAKDSSEWEAVWVVEDLGERDKICIAGRDDRLRRLEVGDQPDGNHRHPCRRLDRARTRWSARCLSRPEPNRFPTPSSLPAAPAGTRSARRRRPRAETASGSRAIRRTRPRGDSRAGKETGGAGAVRAVDLRLRRCRAARHVRPTRRTAEARGREPARSSATGGWSPSANGMAERATVCYPSGRPAGSAGPPPTARAWTLCVRHTRAEWRSGCRTTGGRCRAYGRWRIAPIGPRWLGSSRSGILSACTSRPTRTAISTIASTSACVVWKLTMQALST